MSAKKKDAAQAKKQEERRQACAEAAKTLVSRSAEERGKHPYVEDELKLFRGRSVRFATREEAKEKRCPHFAQQGACPWGGQFHELHIVDVRRPVWTGDKLSVEEC